MPRYRIVKPIPTPLGFRDGDVYFIDYYAGGKEWVWYARSDATRRGIEIFRAEGADGLERVRRDGFDVPADSLADGLMQSLVRYGCAERLAGK